MTKTLFLSLFFSALFPFGLFLTCFGYTFIYVVDKYSLLRSWRTDQQVDDDMTKISRMHMTFAVYVHAVMSMVFYSEFPFDGVCPNTGPLNDKMRMAPEDVADGQYHLLCPSAKTRPQKRILEQLVICAPFSPAFAITAGSKQQFSYLGPHGSARRFF